MNLLELMDSVFTINQYPINKTYGMIDGPDKLASTHENRFRPLKSRGVNKLANDLFWFVYPRVNSSMIPVTSEVNADLFPALNSKCSLTEGPQIPKCIMNSHIKRKFCTFKYNRTKIK